MMILSKALKLWRSDRPDEWIMDEFIHKAKELETATAELKPLLDALEICRDQFKFYHDEHLSNGKNSKALTNGRVAILCDEALAPYTRIEQECERCEGEGNVYEYRYFDNIGHKLYCIKCPDCQGGKIKSWGRK